MTIGHPLDIFFKHNLWANLRLLAACQDLTDDQMNHTPKGTFGSILQTLGHIVDAEERYIFHITAGKQNLSPQDPKASSSIIELQKRASASGKAILEIATSADGEEMVWVGSDKDAFQFSIEALHHASEHRTQVETTLGQLGLETPGLSGWRYFDEKIKS